MRQRQRQLTSALILISALSVQSINFLVRDFELTWWYWGIWAAVYFFSNLLTARLLSDSKEEFVTYLGGLLLFSLVLAIFWPSYALFIALLVLLGVSALLVEFVKAWYDTHGW